MRTCSIRVLRLMRNLYHDRSRFEEFLTSGRHTVCFSVWCCSPNRVDEMQCLYPHFLFVLSFLCFVLSLLSIVCLRILCSCVTFLYSTNIHTLSGIFFVFLLLLYSLVLCTSFFFLIVLHFAFFLYLRHTITTFMPPAGFFLRTLSVLLCLDCPDFAFCPLLYNTNIRTPGGSRTRNPSNRAATDLRLRRRRHGGSKP